MFALVKVYVIQVLATECTKSTRIDPISLISQSWIILEHLNAVDCPVGTNLGSLSCNGAFLKLITCWVFNFLVCKVNVIIIRCNEVKSTLIIGNRNLFFFL